MKKFRIILLLMILILLVAPAPTFASDNISNLASTNNINKTVNYINENINTVFSLRSNMLINDYYDIVMDKSSKIKEVLNLNANEYNAYKNGLGLSDEKHDLLQEIVYNQLVSIEDLANISEEEKVIKIVENLFCYKE